MPQIDPHSSTDVLDPIYKKLASLQAQVDSLQNLSIPTVPTYDPGNYPQDSVEGQVAVGIDNLLHFFVNGLWRTAGGDVPFANWKGNSGYVNPGGINYTWQDMDYLETNNHDVFETGPSAAFGSNGLTNVLKLKQPGVYTCIAFALFLVPIPDGADEPADSWMFCAPDSFNFTADELDTFWWTGNPSQGRPNGGFGATIRNNWFPWQTESINYEASELPPSDPDYMEFVPALFNGGSLPLRAISYLLCIRWSSSEITF